MCYVRTYVCILSTKLKRLFSPPFDLLPCLFYLEQTKLQSNNNLKCILELNWIQNNILYNKKIRPHTKLIILWTKWISNESLFLLPNGWLRVLYIWRECLCVRIWFSLLIFYFFLIMFSVCCSVWSLCVYFRVLLLLLWLLPLFCCCWLFVCFMFNHFWVIKFQPLGEIKIPCCESR